MMSAIDPLTGASQTFRPVALEVDGDGIEVNDKANGVAFDVDDSGYLKQTAWIKGDDAMLVLDRNFAPKEVPLRDNGQIDSGRELFSNSTVALGRRGLAVTGLTNFRYGTGFIEANYFGDEAGFDYVAANSLTWKKTA